MNFIEELRNEIDATPSLFSAIHQDPPSYQAIEIEINSKREAERWATPEEVRRAMDLRPVATLTNVVQATGHASGRAAL